MGPACFLTRPSQRLRWIRLSSSRCSIWVGGLTVLVQNSTHAPSSYDQSRGVFSPPPGAPAGYPGYPQQAYPPHGYPPGQHGYPNGHYPEAERKKGMNPMVAGAAGAAVGAVGGAWIAHELSELEPWFLGSILMFPSRRQQSGPSCCCWWRLCWCTWWSSAPTTRGRPESVQQRPLVDSFGC